MADHPTIKKGASWPPLRFVAADEKGLLPLATAQSITVVMKGRAATVQGVAVPIDPPDEDGFNGQYPFAPTDTTVLDVGMVETELVIDWGAGKVQKVPGKAGPVFEVTPALS